MFWLCCEIYHTADAMVPFEVLRARLLQEDFQQYLVVELCCRFHGSWRVLVEALAGEAECPRCHSLRPAGFVGKLVTKVGNLDTVPRISTWGEQLESEHNVHKGGPLPKLRKCERWESPLKDFGA